MRMIVIGLGWALVLAALGLLGLGIVQAAPGSLDSSASAARQVAAQNWSLARGVDALLLAGLAQIGAMGAFILAQMLPQAETGEDWHGTLARVASAAEAIRRESRGQD